MNVFLYARVSTPEQAKKDLSIPDQLRQLREYCQQHNHTILNEYIEPGVTATDDKRPAFQQMIGDALSSDKKAEAILVLTTSRFFRDALKAKVYKRKLKKSGIKVIAIKQETTDDPMGNFIEGIFELIDQYESETNGFHTLRGMKENARKGYCNGATAPYGYKRVKVHDDKGNEKTKLEINPTEAETVRLIFNLYHNGDNGNRLMGSKLVAMYLNEHSFRRRSGQKWSMQSILAILSNPTYAGTCYFNKRDSKTGKPKPQNEWIPIQVPAIIEKNVFEKVQEIIDKRDPRKTNPAIIASPSLLLGLLKCGKCGASMIRETGKSNQYNYYNCRIYMRQGKPSCTGQRVPRELFEKQVLEHLADKIFSVERTKILLNELYKAYKAEKEKNNERLHELNERLKEIQKGLNNQYSAIEQGVVDLSDVKERIQELKNQKEATLKAIEQLKSKFTIPMHLFTTKNIETFQKQLKDTFTSNNPILTKNYLKTLVERITIRDNSVHIEGKIHGALQLLAEKEKAAGLVNPNMSTEVPTAVLSWLPRKGKEGNFIPVSRRISLVTYIKRPEIRFNHLYPDRTLGARIRDLRIDKKLTRIDLAKQVGCSKNLIVRYERGLVSNPNPLILQRIASHLNVSPLSLLGLPNKGNFIDSIIPPASFMSRLKNLRLKKGLRQAELARKVGLTKATICRYEKGITKPDTKILQTIAKILEVNIAELMP